MTEEFTKAHEDIKKAAENGDIDFASQDKLRFFTQEIVDRFLRCLYAEHAFITDHSMIRHFEGETHNTREKIITRMKTEFGVDIAPVYQEELPTVLYFIQTNKTK